MSTGYAIVRTTVRRNAPPEVKTLRVVWQEADAVDQVKRLNALVVNAPVTHTVQAIWVARPPEAAGGPALTPADREKLELARAHDAIGTERPLSVFFSFTFDREGALAAGDELRALGWPEAGIDEEVTGDDCWHAYAFRRRLVLSEEAIAQLRGEMEDLADRHGGVYDGWDVSGGGGLRSAKLGELPV